ncbi:hypothetical protein [Sporomusa sp. KB1]|uniref:hypothetical protein n=1 Tax=Sporomusa sp. KB1 TaxID=943346 RepID=UPI001C93FD93|nr:hypothetical protein [Sporomusa sp. KB1]
MYKLQIDLYYCVEPIGPEHSYQELIDEMMRARLPCKSNGSHAKDTCARNTFT